MIRYDIWYDMLFIKCNWVSIRWQWSADFPVFGEVCYIENVEAYNLYG
jgi:hypothetical protein